MLDKKKKLKVVEKFRTHKNDTGSTEVQVAILTEEIKELTNHLKTHKKDFSSRRGLLAKVALRHKLLRYLEREDDKRFIKLVKALKLKIAKRELQYEDGFPGNKNAKNKKEEVEEKKE